MLDLHLTAADQRRLATALDALVSPLAHETLDGWRAEVCRTVKELLGADMATFQLPVQDEQALFSTDIDTDQLRKYQSAVAPVERDFDVASRLREARVLNRKILWGDHLGEYRRTAYYNDFIRPLRAFDALMAGVPLREEAREPRISATDPRRAMAILYFHHEHPDRNPFGAQGLGLLRLLPPAFEAGVRTWMKASEQWGPLLAVLDRMEDAAVIADRSGEILHENDAARTITADDPGGERVRSALRRLARSLGRHGGSGVIDDDGDPGRGDTPEHRVITPRGVYRIRGSLVDGATGPGGPLALAWTSGPHEGLPSARELRDAHGLTPRETEVALLLARRLSNAEIARHLDVSPHTARHHTERVFLKLGVHSRRVAARVVRETPRS